MIDAKGCHGALLPLSPMEAPCFYNLSFVLLDLISSLALAGTHTPLCVCMTHVSVQHRPTDTRNIMGDMGSNMNLLLEAGISSAMFDIDPGDEVNHPAQQFLNSADGNQSMSVDESPNFGSLGADNVMGSPPLLPLQGDVDGGGGSVLSDVVATSIADNVAAAASAVPHPEHVEESIPAERSLLPTLVPAAAVAASATAQSNNLFSRGAGNIASCTTSRLRQRSDSEVTRKSTAMLKEQWMSRYKELIEWKRKHGNCNVPQREKKLGCWVSTQRTQYKLLCEGRQSQMNQERIVSTSKQERIVGILLKVALTFDLLLVACIGTFTSQFFSYRKF